MSDNIKTEFKDFINVLSTEICKGVLLDDLKSINKSFDETSRNYKDLYSIYTTNINSIKEQLIKLQDTNLILSQFISNVNKNNDRVNKALEIIEGDHKKVIDNIILDNKKLFDEYSRKVQFLNNNERIQFISQLTATLDTQSINYMSELREIIDNNKIEDILKNIDATGNRIDDLEFLVLGIAENLPQYKEKILKENKKNIETSGNLIVSKLEEMNVTAYSMYNEINAKIQVLDKKIDKRISIKTNIIIVLNLIIISIFIILMIGK